MLQDLHIENIAVISRADISFEKGLNVLTGETGAGKSIIIDALQSVLGARTSRELVRAGAEKALVSAVFESEGAASWLEENEIDCDGELILQRRVTEEGKTSARVCGVPVSAAQLRELSSLLLDLHGQNDGRQLMDESRHREYLDAFGGCGGLLSEFSAAYVQYKATKKEIQSLSMDESEKERLAESLRSMIEELEAAGLREGEEEELLERRELLRNSEKLTEAINAAYGALYGNEENAVTLTQEAAGEARRAAVWHRELEGLAKTLSDAGFILRDAAETLGDISRGLDFSPEEYDRVESRLAQLKRLSKRYGGNAPELLKKLGEAKERLDDIEYSGERLAKLEAKLENDRTAAGKAAGKLTEARRAAASELEKRIVEELTALSMPSVRFMVDIMPIDGETGFDSTGGDRIRFLMSANRGEKAGAISRIASGGELSRIMLAMKNVFSRGDPAETMVFDEIDTGVSGIAAQRVAEKLAELSREKQVLCVTHLPQIAAMADVHFRIEKSERDGRTFTEVIRLDEEGRAMELARLHGGDNVTENTLKAAREQLQAAEEYKEKLRRKGECR